VKLEKLGPWVRILAWYGVAFLVTRWTGSDALVWIIGATMGGRQIAAESRRKRLGGY